MALIIAIILVLVLAGAGGLYGRRAGFGPSRYALGIVLLVLVVVLLVWLLNEATMPPVPMPAGTPSIMR